MTIKFTIVKKENIFNLLIKNIKSELTIGNKDSIISWLERNKKLVNSNNYVIMSGDKDFMHDGGFKNSISDIKLFIKCRRYYNTHILYKNGVRDRSLE